MREEYDIKNLNPRKNPYSNKVKKTGYYQPRWGCDCVL